MNRIDLTNFRVFDDTTTFLLAPITILTGKNNSGKSSLIKALLLLSDYLGQQRGHAALALDGPLAAKHKLYEFRQIKNWSNEGLTTFLQFKLNEIDFSFDFSAQEEDAVAQLQRFAISYSNFPEGLLLERAGDYFNLTTSQQFIDAFPGLGMIPFRSEEKQAELMREAELEQRLDAFKREFEDLIQRLKDMESSQDHLAEVTPQRVTERIQKDQMYLRLVDERQRMEERIRALERELKPLKSRRSIPYQAEIKAEEAFTLRRIIGGALATYADTSTKWSKSTTRFHDTRTEFLRFAQRIEDVLQLRTYHLSPNRTHQARLYFKFDHASEINEIINEFAQNQPADGSAADLFLKTWLSRFELGTSLRVKSVKGEASSIEIKRGGKFIDLADMGFGTGQLLTMLLKTTSVINQIAVREGRYNRRSEIILLIEEPESNLHPFLQSQLIEMFVEANQKHGIQFLLETHSEYLIRQTQVLVKEFGKNHPFRVYYFDAEKGPYEMRFREDGKFMDEFGKGFFDEARRLAFEIL